MKCNYQSWQSRGTTLAILLCPLSFPPRQPSLAVRARPLALSFPLSFPCALHSHRTVAHNLYYGPTGAAHTINLIKRPARPRARPAENRPISSATFATRSRSRRYYPRTICTPQPLDFPSYFRSFVRISFVALSRRARERAFANKFERTEATLPARSLRIQSTGER